MHAHETHRMKYLSLQRDAEAIRTALYLGVALAITWIIGAGGLSLAWLVLVLALATTIVKARVSRLLQTELQHELARLRRRRALYKDETAEWLSLLLNKWQVPFLVIDEANQKREYACATWYTSMYVIISIDAQKEQFY